MRHIRINAIPKRIVGCLDVIEDCAVIAEIWRGRRIAAGEL
jgi:hypothetical protein